MLLTDEETPVSPAGEQLTLTGEPAPKPAARKKVLLRSTLPTYTADELSEAVEKTDGCAELIDSCQQILGRIFNTFTVTLAGKEYDTVRLIDIQYSDGAMLCEHYLDRTGRTVLWRRFNADDWALAHYGRPWTDKLPDNERLTVNGKTFVHWYDCITDRFLA